MKLLKLVLLFISISLSAQEKETITWDEATINNKLTLTVSKQEFDRIYKKADSIVTPKYEDICGTDADSNFQYVYYKGVQFEMDNRILNFRKITFSKKSPVFFSLKTVKFDGNITLNAFKKFFSNVTSGLNEDQLKALETTTDAPPVVILPSETGEEYQWLFYFSKGKLSAIECNFPCD